MTYLIGTDEAGYGPNLGPLVVSASLWQVPDDVRGEDLYSRLAEVIVPTRRKAAESPEKRIAVADSKTLYQPGAGLRHLERALWAVWDCMDRRPNTWSDVWRTLAPESADQFKAIPWYADYDQPAPFDAEPDELRQLAPALRAALADANIKLLGLHSRAMFPKQFNELLDNGQNKAGVLSNLTLDLVARLVEPVRDGPISILCDKHGGRNRYAALLDEHFPGAMIEIYGEGRDASVYRFGPPQRRVEIRFQSKAEAHMSVALASMASKYLRELAMRAFNTFWCDRVPGVQPTAGYPLDAKRFRKDIAAMQAELDIDDCILWRNK